MSTVVESDADFEGEGLDYDPINNKMYYCSYGRIYRANVDGSATEALLSNVNCEF